MEGLRGGGLLRKTGKDGGGGSSSLSRKLKVSEVKKEKRRPRLILSDTESDEDLHFHQRKADWDRDEVTDPKTYDWVHRKKVCEGAEIDIKSVTKKRMEKTRVWAGSFKSGINTEIDRKRMSTDLLRPKGENTGSKADRGSMLRQVDEKQKRGSDYFKDKELGEVERKRLKTQNWKCKEGKNNMLQPCIYRKDSEVDRRSAGVGNKRMNSVDYLSAREDTEDDGEDVKMEFQKGREARIEFKRKRVLDPKPKGPIAQWKQGEMTCNQSTLVDQKRVSLSHRNDSSVVNRNRDIDHLDKKIFRFDKDEKFCLAGTSKEKFKVLGDNAIRVQGKGGVLKLLSNNKMKVDGSEKLYYRRKQNQSRKDDGLFSLSNSRGLMPTPFPGVEKLSEKSGSSVARSKSHSNLHKFFSDEENKANCLKIDDNGMSFLGETRGMDDCTTVAEETSKKDSGLEMEIPIPAEKKDIGRRNGRRQEKQLLCDRIKHMLFSVGWKVDYRPRKSRDYKDAVYIAPSGTEYWSIVKAYYAFQKQMTSKDNDGCSTLENLKDCEQSGTFSGSDHKLQEMKTLSCMIPEEELSMLKRNTTKKKSGKKLKGEGGNKDKKEFKQKKYMSKKLKENAGSSLKKGKQNSKSSRLSGRAQSASCSSDGHFIQGRENRKGRGCALLARSSSKGVNVDNDDYVPYPGKRNIFSWLIDSGIICDNGKVQYMNKKRNRVMLEGWITMDGIHCICCSKILTALKFEIHAGSKLGQPLENIFLETGSSLLQALLDAWDKQEEAERRGFHFIDIKGDDPNDDTCGICGDGGDLICCDSCPSTFHQSCLNIQMLPPGDWHCSYCSCRFCGVFDRIEDDAVTASLLSCSQCEEKYHQGCIPEFDAVPVESSSPHTSFCGKSCGKLFDRLQNLIGVKNYLDAGFSWMLIRRFDNSDTSAFGLVQRAECNSRIAVALEIMDECFFPITDQRSGVNIMRSVVYNCGSNFNRLNHSGFYTVVLERGDEIICAASIRIHGTKLAEMPFIGTRHMYRRQGMCRRLLNAIEAALCSLDVEKLIIPAISELMDTWTQVFGFKPLEESNRQEVRSLNMMVFPAVDMLQKPLCSSDGNTTGNAVCNTNDTESTHNDIAEVENASFAAVGVHGSENCDAHDVNTVDGTVAAKPVLPTCGEGTQYDESQNKSSSSAPDVPQDKLEVEDRSLVASPVEPVMQTCGVSVRGSADGNHDVKNETGDVESEVHAFDENSVRYTSETANASPDSVSVSDCQHSVGSTMQFNSKWLVKPQESPSNASSVLA